VRITPLGGGLSPQGPLFGLADLERCILSDHSCYPQGTPNAHTEPLPENDNTIIVHGKAPFSEDLSPVALILTDQARVNILPPLGPGPPLVPKHKASAKIYNIFPTQTHTTSSLIMALWVVRYYFGLTRVLGSATCLQ